MDPRAEGSAPYCHLGCESCRGDLGGVFAFLVRICSEGVGSQLICMARTQAPRICGMVAIKDNEPSTSSTYEPRRAEIRVQ